MADVDLRSGREGLAPNSLRIAVLQSFLPPASQGGVGHFADQLMRHLVRRGHLATVFSLDRPAVEVPYRVVAPDANARWRRSRLGRVYGCGLWLRRQSYVGFDVIHALGDDHFLRREVPIVRTFNGSALGEAIHAQQFKTRAMFASIYPLEIVASLRASGSVIVSRSTQSHFPWVRTMIPNGIDLDLFRPGAKSGNPTILSVGHGLNDRKRLGLLIEVFRSVVRPRVPAAQLWIVADDGVDIEGVSFRGGLSGEELAETYRRAWVFCLPSSYEGFGRPYVEALASGTAVLSTPNPGALEILDQGRWGLIAEPRHLGESLVKLLLDTELRTRLADRGLRRARSYDWRAVVLDYEAVYANVMRGNDER